MEAHLTWLDLTVRDRTRMRQVIDLFSEKDTVDELGLGTLRDMFADALFPGTSTLQTRLRYVLFVPWLYQSLERRRVAGAEVATQARSAELALIHTLGKSNDVEGIIGSVAKANLIRLPSNVYWSSLARWGIFAPGKTQGWYHTHFASLVRARDDIGRTDDPGVVWDRKATWHPRLPAAPEGFPATASFALTRAEAEFVRGRIEETCPGSLLSWLAREGSSSLASDLWADPHVQRASGELGTIVEAARRFSLHVEGGPLLYNLLLAERRHTLHGQDEALIARYRAALSGWAVREREEVPFNPSALWAMAARRGVRLVEPQRQFVASWSARVLAVGAAGLADDDAARRLIEQRELKLKGQRSRFANAARLLDYSGAVGVGRMGFRWYRVRQMLIDLHRGLES